MQMRSGAYTLDPDFLLLFGVKPTAPGERNYTIVKVGQVKKSKKCPKNPI